MTKKKSKNIGTIAAGNPMVDRKWQAQCDARTLADAKVIQGDRGRMSRAVAEAKKMVTEKRKEADAIGRVAKMKGKKK